ncbi:hypothetical protein OLO86_07105 [Campylobacter jejuni]|nr:hypothetical protein [Campylobacter jejuni]
MFILKKTGSETNISVQSIKDAVKNNDLIAQVNRKLNYKIKNTQSYANNNFMFQVKEFIDDITQEELNKGLEAVKEFLAMMENF